MYGLNYHAGSSGRILPLKARCICILQVQVDYGRGEWVTTSPINRTLTFFWPGSSLNAPANAASVLSVIAESGGPSCRSSSAACSYQS